MELTALCISLFSFYYSKKKYKSTHVSISRQFQAPIGSGIIEHKLRVATFAKNQQVFITKRPKLVKKRFLFYSENIDTDISIFHDIDPETKRSINNPFFLNLDEFIKLSKGKHKIILYIDRPPYKLKSKFSLPFEKSIITKRNH